MISLPGTNFFRSGIFRITQRVDLSTPKAYRVYASNGAYVTYTVTAYTEEPSPTQSLWEKLQNQINSNPNWWELAEYQKKTGYYK